MPTCSFCKKNYEFPRGLTLFTIDGKTVYFCSSKCKRNLALKRDPKKTNWVKRVKKLKGKIEVEKEIEEKQVEVKESSKKEIKEKVKKDAGVEEGVEDDD